MAQRTTTLDPHSGFSRRDFLRGSGAVAAAATLHEQTTAALAQEKGAKVASGQQTITLNVNGKDQQVKVEPRTTLMEALRYQLDLTGCKPVCTDGSSGAATVLVDGKPMQANTMLAMQAVGKKITTVEGLANDAVPKAFVVLKHGIVSSAALAIELQDHVKRELAPYKYPREIEFIDALPRTETGKIRRVELRERERQRKAVR